MSLRAVASSFQSVNYQGTWDASTNDPTLTSSVGTKGHYYVVSVAGSTNLNGITNWGVGDWAVFNGSAWQRVEGGADGNFVNLSVSGTASFAAGTVSAPAITTTGDTNTGIFFPAADTISFAEGGTEAMRITSTGSISLGAAPGSESLLVSPVASAVNYLQASGAIASGNPTLAATGTDTNVNLTLLPRGTGGVLAVSTGQTVAAISTATLGGGIGVFDAGSVGGSGGTLVFGAVSGGWRFAAIKSFATNGSNNTQGDLYFLTRRTNSDATLTPAMQISSGGTISLASSLGSESIRVSPVASAVNYWDFVGSTTGNFIATYASGTDANIDIKLIPKGTGLLSFGTYTAGIIAQAGYITIKDSGGNSRRLLVG